LDNIVTGLQGCSLDFLGNFTVLKEVWLDGTDTGGASIPTTIGSLGDTLEVFSASSASLNGTIPTEISSLDDLTTLWLFNNDIGGTIPLSINGLNKLEELFVQGNPRLGGGLIGDICLLGGLNIGSDCTTSGGRMVCACCECCSVDDCAELVSEDGQRTDEPTRAPVEAPLTEAPVAEMTEAPVVAGTEAPVIAEMTEAPVVAGTETPVVADTEAPVTEAPVVAGTEAPVFIAGGTEDCPDVLCRLSLFALQGGDEFNDFDGYQFAAYIYISDYIDDAMTMPLTRLKQYYALACLYFETFANDKLDSGVDVSGWLISDGWMSTGGAGAIADGETDFCTWYGITCDDDGMLIETLALSANNMHGIVPNEAQLLSDTLAELDLSINSGLCNNGDEEMQWIGNMGPALKTLVLRETRFEYDGMPAYINQLTSLEKLDLGYSLFRGPKDGAPFIGLSSLTYLALDGLAFDNCLPPEIATETGLTVFLLNDATGLDGCDLSWMGSMPDLVKLVMDRTDTGGAMLPTELGLLNKLEEFTAMCANLGGSIPPEAFEGLDSIVKLHLHQNSLQGFIPLEVSELNKLQEMYLQGNPELHGGLVGDLCLLNPLELGADCTTSGGNVVCACCDVCSATEVCMDVSVGEPTEPPIVTPDLTVVPTAMTESPTAATESPTTATESPTTATEAPTSPTESPSLPSTEAPVALDCPDVLCRLSAIALQGGDEFNDFDGYQYAAYGYISNHVDDAMTMPLTRLKQYYALVTLYLTTYASAESDADMDVLGWINSDGWLSIEDDELDFCTWYGVTCEEDGVLVEILDLSNNTLYGVVPDEIQLLGDSIAELDLSLNCGLSNSGDEEMMWIGEMGTSLKVLVLRETSFQYDGMPAYINQLTSIEKLDFGFSSFRGPKDGTPFIGLSSLTYLALDGLEFDNCIPPEVATETMLTVFIVSDVVGLQGCDLSWIGLMTGLVTLHMDRTDTGGAMLPTEMGLLNKLEEFKASFANLGGSIPGVVLEGLDSLVTLHLHQNFLESVIPPEVNGLNKVQEMYLQGNPNLRGGLIGDLCLLSPLQLGADCTTAGGGVVCSCCDCCSSEECADDEIAEITSTECPDLPAASTGSPSGWNAVEPTAAPVTTDRQRDGAEPDETLGSKKSKKKLRGKSRGKSRKKGYSSKYTRSKYPSIAEEDTETGGKGGKKS